jgi:autotransporter-associated beta strand protein
MKRITTLFSTLNRVGSTRPTWTHANRFALLLLTASLATGTIRAGTHTWNGGSTDGRWSIGANWDGNNPPAANESPLHLVFPASATRRLATNNIANITISSITFDGAAYTIAASGAGTNVTFDSSVGMSYWNVRALSGSGHTFHYSMNLALDGTLEFNIATNASVTLRSRLSASSANSGLSKDGQGMVVLDPVEDNTFDGATSVLDGTLRLEGSHVEFGFNVMDVTIPGPLIIGGNSLTQHPTCVVWSGHQISDSSAVTVNRNGQLLLADVNDTIGSLTMAAGIVDTGNGTLTLNGNVQVINPPSGTPSQVLGNLGLGTIGRIFTVETNADLEMSASISGGFFGNLPAGFIKSGPGWMTLLAYSNSFSGDVYVSAGTLAVTGGNQLGTGTNGTGVASGGTLLLGGIGFGPTIASEKLSLASGARLQGALDSAWNGPVELYGDAIVDVPNSGITLTMGGVISGVGSLHKIGDGDLEFTGFGGNTFTGGFTCEEGSTSFNKSASAPALSGPLVVGKEGSSVWTYVSISQMNQIPNNLPITLLDYGALATDSGVTETVGPVDIKGGLLYGGGTITLNSGVTNHVSTLGGVGSLTGDILLPATRTFHCDAFSSLMIGDVHGNGGIIKTGPGTLYCGVPNSYNGQTLVLEGLVMVENQGQLGSTVSGTIVESSAVLYLSNASVTNEALVLKGGGANNTAELVYHGTNIWNGPIEIHGGATLQANPTASKLSLIGPISGDGGLNHIGDGTLVLSGSGDNTFDGTMTFPVGTLMLSKPGAFAAIPNSLILGYSADGSPGALAKCTAPNQFAPAFAAELFFNSVTINPNCTLDCNGFDQTVPNLNLNHGVAKSLGSGVLTLNGTLSVQPANGSDSYVYGSLRLDPGVSANHTVTVATNINLWLIADVSESASPQNIYKDGQGTVLAIGSNSFSGTLTIHQGLWAAQGTKPFGTPAGATIVDAGASLYTYAGAYDEPLQLAGNGNGKYSALFTASTNQFTGPVTLQADTAIGCDTNGTMALSGVISGPGGLTKQGAGTLQFLGSAANTYAGATFVTNGKLELGKTNSVAVPGALTITGPNSSSQVRLLLPEQIADQSPVVLQNTGWIALEGHNETIGSLAGMGAIFQFANQTGLLTIGGNGDSTTFAGTILGGGGLTKTGAGTFTLTANNSYTGTTAVQGGTLLVFGQQPQSPVSLQSGGTLGGSGRVGNISALAGHISPGASPGILVCSNFATFSPGNLLKIEINGATPGTGYDQLQVNGTVLLMGGGLQISMNTVGAISNQYIIVSNDGAEAVTGTFPGMPEGALLGINGVGFTITYHGGDGNDIALMQQTLGAPPKLTSIQKVGNSTQLHGTGAPNAQYVIEAAESLNPPTAWVVIGNATANGVGDIQFSDDASQYPIRFYRLRLP